jgi:hypothetical protein
MSDAHSSSGLSGTQRRPQLGDVVTQHQGSTVFVGLIVEGRRPGAVRAKWFAYCDSILRKRHLVQYAGEQFPRPPASNEAQDFTPLALTRSGAAIVAHYYPQLIGRRLWVNWNLDGGIITPGDRSYKKRRCSRV